MQMTVVEGIREAGLAVRNAGSSPRSLRDRKATKAVFTAPLTGLLHHQTKASCLLLNSAAMDNLGAIALPLIGRVASFIFGRLVTGL
jgi:hypothetical protein